MKLTRTLAAAGLAVLVLVVLVLGEILAARARTYLVTVDFTVDEVVGPVDGGPVLELRVLGDSTAAGVGTTSESDSVPVLLARRVAEALDRPVHVVGLGVSGARTDDVRREQLPALADVNDDADVVVILVGSNDVIHATSPGQMRERTSAMLTDARALGAPIVVGGIPRFNGVGAFARPLRDIVDGYARVLRDEQRAVVEQVAGADFVDIAADASPRFVGRPESMSSDQFHPSTVGYGFWADALAPAVIAAAER